MSSPLISIRDTEGLGAELDSMRTEIARLCERFPEISAVDEPSRSDVLRLAAAIGLRALRERLGAPLTAREQDRERRRQVALARQEATRRTREALRSARGQG